MAHFSIDMTKRRFAINQWLNASKQTQDQVVAAPRVGLTTDIAAAIFVKKGGCINEIHNKLNAVEEKNIFY